ncbi:MULTISPECIES: hypothetical protein [unclassified Luteococcus]|uniref:hypothetical protein n=1 Tax=unclassified Luteococcus TaxID=2639923 RepID=UPI00313DB58C
MSATSPAHQDWIPAAPFRAHFQLLLEQTGLPWRVVALATGVPARLAQRLALAPPGRDRIRRADALRLITVGPDDLLRLGDQSVACRAAGRRLAALAKDAGLDTMEIARVSGLTPNLAHQLLTDRLHRCSRLTLLRVQACCDQLEAVPGAAPSRIPAA